MKSSISPIKTVLALLISLVLVISGCSEPKQESESKAELLIYCGITMIGPMHEIAKIVEAQTDCKITITKGGSGNLLKSIIHNETGDLYLPGSETYYTIIEEEHPGLVTDTVFVGHNKAVMMTQKGNPKGLTSDLSHLTNSSYGVMIGNPTSGSIGKETKKILEKRDLFDDVLKNVMCLTTDSKDLLKAIKRKEADIVINWYATSTWGDNNEYIDVIEIDPAYAKKKKLILGLLKYSKHPSQARNIMDLASSARGREIFNSHGLYLE